MYYTLYTFKKIRNDLAISIELKRIEFSTKLVNMKSELVRSDRFIELNFVMNMNMEKLFKVLITIWANMSPKKRK